LKNHRSGILLVLVLLVPFVFTYVFLQHQKQLIRKEMKTKILAGLPEEELAFFKFSTKDLSKQIRWHNDNEFKYAGEMYDVVQRQIKNDSVSLWCWHDSEETRLEKQIERLVSKALGTNTQSKEQKSNLNNFLKSLYFSNKASWEMMLPTPDKILFSEPFYWDARCFLTPPTPPPQNC